MDLQELICLKQLFQGDCFCEVSPQTAYLFDYLLLALESDWRASEGIPFLSSCAATSKERRGKTLGKAICPLCVYRVWGYQPVSSQCGKTISKMKEKQAWVSSRFSFWWPKHSDQNVGWKAPKTATRWSYVYLFANRGIITDDLAPFNTSWHAAHCSDLPHPAVFPFTGVQLSRFLLALFNRTVSSSLKDVPTFRRILRHQSKQQW